MKSLRNSVIVPVDTSGGLFKIFMKSQCRDIFCLFEIHRKMMMRWPGGVLWPPVEGHGFEKGALSSGGQSNSERSSDRSSPLKFSLI